MMDKKSFISVDGLFYVLVPVTLVVLLVLWAYLKGGGF